MSNWKPREKVYRWRPVVDKYAVKYQLSQALILAVIEMESGGNEKAFRFEPGFYDHYLKNNTNWQKLMQERGYTPEQVSSSYGLMQLMYPTAWMLGFRGDPEELYDPDINIDLGCKYLRKLMNRYNNDHMLALAHYNGGSTGAKQFINEETDKRPVRYAYKVNNIYKRYKEYNQSLLDD